MKKAIIIIAVLVLLLVGAFLLYDILGRSNAPDQLSPQEPAQEDVNEDAQKPAQDGAQAPAGSQENADGGAAVTAAPDFTVYDADGNGVLLSDYRGKPVVLNFWASWCGPCKQEMPDFQEKYAELGDSVQFLMVNVTDGSRESVDSASAFIEEQGYTFPVFYDTSLEAVTEYGISGIPATFFIDADGVIAAHAVGSI